MKTWAKILVAVILTSITLFAMLAWYGLRSQNVGDWISFSGDFKGILVRDSAEIFGFTSYCQLDFTIVNYFDSGKQEIFRKEYENDSWYELLFQFDREPAYNTAAQFFDDEENGVKFNGFRFKKADSGKLLLKLNKHRTLFVTFHLSDGEITAEFDIWRYEQAFENHCG